MTNETTTKDITATINTSPSGMPESLSIVFSTGKSLTLTENSLSQSMRLMCMFHGAKQKIVDAAALSRDTATGRSATIADKYDAAVEVYNRLLAGEWNKTRGDGAPAGGILFRALCLVYSDKTPEAMREWLSKKTPADRAKIRKLPKVAAAIATLQAAAPIGDVDEAELMDGLE